MAVAMPKTVAAPMSGDDDAPADATDTGDETGMTGDEDGDETVLVTITKGADGGYTVYAGDEPEEDGGEGEEGDEGAADGGDEGDETGTGEGGTEAAAGAPEAGGEDEGAEAEPEGEKCETIGAALKAAMDILKNDEAESNGEGSDQDNFAAGFAGGSEASPPTPAMAQKY